jgi:hypothetical protein
MEHGTLLAHLKDLAASIDPDVRRQALQRLKSEVSVECEGAFELLESFSYDPKADIRAEAVRGFVAFPHRAEIVWRGLTLGEIDPSTEVRAAAIEAAFVASDPELEVALIALGQMFRTHTDRELRLALAAGMSMFNCGRVLDDNIAATVGILLVCDRDPEVRRRMAAGGVVLFNYPYLEEIFIQAAENDHDAGVRACRGRRKHGRLPPSGGDHRVRWRSTRRRSDGADALGCARHCKEQPGPTVRLSLAWLPDGVRARARRCRRVRKQGLNQCRADGSNPATRILTYSG